MITPLLKNALSPLVAHHRRLRALYATGVALLIAAAAGAALLVGHARLHPLYGAVIAYVLARIVSRRWVGSWEPDYREVARRIEVRHPELHALISTAVEQQPDPATKQLGYLQQRVVAEAVTATRKDQWLDTIPAWSWFGGVLALLLGTAALVETLFFLRASPLAPAKAAAVFSTEAPVTVSPGDTELERGSGLVVLAKFHRAAPSEAVLILQPKNQPELRLPLVKNLGDPVFGGGLPEVTADLSYRIEYAGKTTRDFAVKVFEHPKLERADATVIFPTYTKLPEKEIPDTHRVSAVEGSTLGVTFNLNKPVKSATLVTKDGTKLPLAVTAEKAVAEWRGFLLRKSASYELQLVDADGRENKLPTTFAVEALPNRRPEIKVVTPRGDSRVSPLEEVAFRAEIWDDFGLVRYGLATTIGGGAEQNVELGKASEADEKRSVAYLLKLEDVGVKVDDLVSWYLWAEDVGPDGKVRRTATDIYFAEVRPFEEIFRQGEEQESGKPGAGEAAEKLAELQKQIVSATWNLQRAEDAAAAPEPTPKYLKDEPVIGGSQSEALVQAQKLGEKIEDAKSQALLEKVTTEMKTAVDRLDAAAKKAELLPRALESERAAYNALLKLAAHQFNVTKSKSQSGKQAQNNRQDQLDDLELKEDKKRYETKTEAQPQQNEQQREQLAILNRLKELAQRQNDINERVKELQTALQEAKTDQEKEEAQRQLKRLREEEQQMLADIDEAKQKMEQSAQQAQFADERKQLEQTRGEAQKAAQAMAKNEPSQALASGTRAQEDLQKMREDFRKKTSNQFREEMREMRSDARELAERQQGIAEQLKDEDAKPQQQMLDASSEREKMGEQFAQQQSQLGKLTQNMKRVSEQAEAAEPLLAKELYDTLRKSTQAGTEDALTKTQQLAEHGFRPQAQKFEEKARQEIDALKMGVEKAAESVLGDEAEALRQARAELDALTQAVDKEIAQARPELAQAKEETRHPQTGEKSGKPETASGKDADDAKSAKAGGAPEESLEAGVQTPSSLHAKDGSKPGEQNNETAKAAKGSDGSGAGKPGGPPANGQPEAGSDQKGQMAQTGKGQPGASQEAQKNENGKATQSTQRPGARLAQLSQEQKRDGRGSPAEVANGGGQTGPLTGGNFVDWQDRLRNVEEMLDAPELRGEVARVREVAKGVRAEFKQHSAQPDWDLVNQKIRVPLVELRNRVTEELARRESKENLVPIDRDPVPTKYAERVRRYYEDLGRGR